MNQARGTRFWRDILAAVATYVRRVAPVETWPRSRLLALKAERLDSLLAAACRGSRFYRRHWGVAAGGAPPRAIHLGELPPVTKSKLMAHFDEVATDSRLRLSGVREALARAVARPGYPSLAGFRLVVTSGSTGEPAVFPYARQEWVEGMALIIRSASFALGGRGRAGAAALLRSALDRPRVAGIATNHPLHVSTQLAASFSGGGARGLRLPAGTPLPELVARLDAFAPTIIGGYPSIIALLAAEQARGHLAIRPQLVFTGGETVTPGTRRHVREIWNVELFDYYGLTETLIIAGECSAHQGLHVYEDAVVLEPRGGDGILATNLFNRTFPLIRYEVSDLVQTTTDPCPCGAPFARLVEISGRREEMLELATRDGEPVRVHPFVIEAPLEEERGVVEFAIRRTPDGLLVKVTAAPGVDAPALGERLAAAIRHTLAPFGLDTVPLQVQVSRDASGERTATGKRRRVT